jgi:hypothetical protein
MDVSTTVLRTTQEGAIWSVEDGTPVCTHNQSSTTNSRADFQAVLQSANIPAYFESGIIEDQSFYPNDPTGPQSRFQGVVDHLFTM